MSFVIEKRGTKELLAVSLKNEKSGFEAEIYLFGGIVNALRYPLASGEKYNVICGYESPEQAAKSITDGFYGAHLSPFVCRLTNASFEFEGKNYRINKHFSGTSALHGLLYDALYTVKSEDISEDRAELVIATDVNAGKEGFPFPYHVEITYTLSANALSVSTEITNSGNADMPISDGWHPYFKLGDTIGDLDVKFDVDEQFIFDKNLLPTGEKKPYHAFSEFKRFGDTFLDNSFLLSKKENAGMHMKNEKLGLQLDILPQENYPVLQIYTPDDRKSIAVENLSSVPDSFNNHIGLIVLKPKVSKRFQTKYVLSAL